MSNAVVQHITIKFLTNKKIKTSKIRQFWAQFDVSFTRYKLFSSGKNDVQN